ncbi:MAG: hypothetical protein ITD42_04020 [Nitrosospira sp.]|nr:hypothetical protein [Nitrosospira sp.]GDX60782.1 hypothetical protein LBMAG32_03160 [Nitrosomonadaceae bacterium]MBI0414718.1 hypothetical protein [Nitrosospira sp.]MBI0415979.1 hypothetical protein [Nitrosospira sp.]MBI0417109.1 hypothetical protein [Nitrosospira sp.]
MDSPEFKLLTALLLIPVAIFLQLWVRRRKVRRRNESGQEEFGSFGSTLMSTIGDGLAVLISLILVIWVVGAILRYLFPAIFGIKL